MQSAEIQTTEKWARKFYKELGEKSPFFRAYQLKDIEKVASVANGVLSKNGGLTEAAHTTKYSISDLFALVKRYDKDFDFKPVNPLLLNEDGTPKVFYHGTNQIGYR